MDSPNNLALDAPLEVLCSAIGFTQSAQGVNELFWNGTANCRPKCVLLYLLSSRNYMDSWGKISQFGMLAMIFSSGGNC